jgi:hypothetical protein
MTVADIDKCGSIRWSQEVAASYFGENSSEDYEGCVGAHTLGEPSGTDGWGPRHLG